MIFMTTVKTIGEVAKASVDVRDFIWGNGYLPELITIGGVQVNRASFLRMVCASILELTKPKDKQLNILTNSYPNPSQKSDNVQDKAQLQKQDYLELANAINTFIKGNGHAPELYTTQYGQLSFYGVIWTMTRVLAYYHENGTLPNYVTLYNMFKQANPTDPDNDGCYRSKRYLKDANIKQDTNYWCACNIFQQIMYELYGLTISESIIAQAMGTTTDGTAHTGIINGGKRIAQRYGHNVSIEFVNYSSLTEKQIGELIANPDVGLFFHDLYKNQWGHYEYIIGLCPNTGTYTVANSLSGGYIEQRSQATMQSYINGISQPSVGIVRKIS
jgi:hypothetical protein